MKLMLVEDEYLLNKSITAYLESKGFTVLSFLDGLDAIDAISDGVDLFIIDIDLPEVNGIDILEQVRMLYPMLPVIMISATIDMDMITKAYTKGCSDYLKKPFDIKELELKIRAFTRTSEQTRELAEGMSYDSKKKSLCFRGKEIGLTPKEAKFIQLLVENLGSIVPHEQIEMAVWGDSMDSAHLRQLVNRLRKKMPVDIIHNRIGEGYMIQ